jgi:4-amino-4-deoxychorismate lyase
MSLLFESIKIVNNSMVNLSYHNARVNLSRKTLYGTCNDWDLKTLITLQGLDSKLLYKCRFVYSEETYSVEFQPYTLKPLKTLQLVKCPDLNYSLKYMDRSGLENIKLSHPQTDDVLIVKNNKITDCSYANIVFDLDGKWVTPASPLLNGTKRQKYIDDQVITKKDIKVKDLKYFKRARIINAMIDLDESPDIRMENIF